jgi:hypothetical protein
MGLPTWNQSEFVIRFVALALTLSIRNLGECENKNVDLVELKRDKERGTAATPMFLFCQLRDKKYMIFIAGD